MVPWQRGVFLEHSKKWGMYVRGERDVREGGEREERDARAEWESKQEGAITNSSSFSLLLFFSFFFFILAIQFQWALSISTKPPHTAHNGQPQ